MTPLIKNILIAGALTGAGIFIYNKWIKKEAVSGFVASGNIYIPTKKVAEVKSNACGCGA